METVKSFLTFLIYDEISMWTTVLLSTASLLITSHILSSLLFSNLSIVLISIFYPIPFLHLSQKKKEKKSDRDFCIYNGIHCAWWGGWTEKRICGREGLSWCTGGLNSLTLLPHPRGPSTAHQLQKLAFPLRYAIPHRTALHLDLSTAEVAWIIKTMPWLLPSP